MSSRTRSIFVEEGVDGKIKKNIQVIVTNICDLKTPTNVSDFCIFANCFNFRAFGELSKFYEKLQILHQVKAQINTM